VRALRRGPASRMPNVSLVCAALGEQDIDGAAVYMLTQQDHDHLLNQVPSHKRRSLRRSLEYILNMSCVGRTHPDLAKQRRWLHDTYGIWVNLQRRRTDVWTWARLSWELNFSGCELLIVDTEGHDAAVLRSMIAHCTKKKRENSLSPSPWPDVIQFETMAHCDKVEGHGTEWGVITLLQNAGYVLVHYSRHNSHLVFGEVLEKEHRVWRWAESFVCCCCGCRGKYPYVSDSDMHVYCRPCLYKS